MASSSSSRVVPLVKLLLKGALAGGAVYAAHGQGLLGGGEEGARALRKARRALPPAPEEWKLPAIPKTEFSLCDAWNSGVRTAVGGLSAAPARAGEYTQHGWAYVKNLAK